jgi:hypothetical protein
MRTIGTHHDGHGLNESLVITADDRDTDKGGGASHRYEVAFEHGDKDTQEAAFIQFQHGPRNVAGSKSGVTEAVLLAVLIDRLEGFQAGPFACRENAIILTKLEECLHWTKARADKRAARGVLGKNEK